MPSKEALQNIIALISGANGKALIVIAGGSCSGKSYFADKLSSELDKLSMPNSVVHLDNYFKDLDDPSLPRSESGRRLFDDPNSYHMFDFIFDVSKLISGKAIRMPAYDKAVCKRIVGSEMSVEPSNIIIAEGLFAISMLRCLESIEKINVFIDASESLRLDRRIKRDALKYGISEDKIRKTFLEKVEPCHLRYVEPQKNQARIIISEIGGE